MFSSNCLLLDIILYLCYLLLTKYYNKENILGQIGHIKLKRSFLIYRDNKIEAENSNEERERYIDGYNNGYCIGYTIGYENGKNHIFIVVMPDFETNEQDETNVDWVNGQSQGYNCGFEDGLDMGMIDK